MWSNDVFSSDYAEARARFVDAAKGAGLALERYDFTAKGPGGAVLSMDVALRRRPGTRRVLVVSSGLHGAEGGFGSACQLALIGEQGLWAKAETDLVLIHALNPYGFAHGRRWNEDNVDLNRSFFAPDEPRPETPPLYAALDGLLNPKRPAPLLDLFVPKALFWIARHGLAALQESLPVGQYDRPKGLFFGGAGESETQRLLANHAPAWLAEYQEILHLDLHTGLGKSATCKLLAGGSLPPARFRAMADRFGAEAMEDMSAEAPGEKVAYAARGTFNDWMPGLAPGAAYDVVTAEFGTYGPVKVLGALRAENMAHHHGGSDGRVAAAKRRLRDAFVPESAAWRRDVLATARALFEQALA